MSSARVCIVAAFGLLAVGGPAWADRESAIAPIDWKHVVTSTDMDRIKGWRTAFIKALENAKARGNAARIESEGALLDPDAVAPDVRRLVRLSIRNSLALWPMKVK